MAGVARRRVVRASSTALALTLFAACGRIGFDGRVGDAREDDAISDVATDTATVGPTDYVAYFPFDVIDTVNLRWADSSGTRFARCTNSTACPVIGLGQFANAAAFDGNDELVVTSDALLESSSAYTVAFWAFVETLPAAACVVSKFAGAGEANSYQLCVNPPNAWTSYATADGVGNNDSIQLVATIGAWHHVVMMWDGAKRTEIIDGDTVSSTPPPAFFDAGDILLGFDIDSAVHADHFTGRLDELRIYNRALTLAEIQALATPP